MGAAATVSAVKGIDSKYDISGRTTRAASQTAKAATDLANKALENPTVNKSWGWMKSMASSAAKSVTGALAETGDVVKQGRDQAKARRSSNTTPTPGSPTPTPAGSEVLNPEVSVMPEEDTGGEAKFVSK